MGGAGTGSERGRTQSFGAGVVLVRWLGGGAGGP